MRPSRGKFEWWSVAKVTTDPPAQFVQVLKNYWWATDSEGNVLMWRTYDNRIAPQANQSQAIAKRLWKIPGVVSITQLPLTLVPIRPEDYA